MKRLARFLESSAIHERIKSRLGYDPLDDLHIVPDFVSDNEQSLALVDCQTRMSRLCRHYSEGHFDKVTVGYKECTVSSWDFGSQSTRDLLERTKKHAESIVGSRVNWLPVHLLELRGENSGIMPHVDYPEALGKVIACLCLQSDAVMEFSHKDYPELNFKVLMPEKCFYLQTLL